MNNSRGGFHGSKYQRKKRNQCQKILKAMDVLEQIYNYEPKNEIEEIYKLYITQEGATNVAKHLNTIGKRINTDRGNRVFTSKDIVKILIDTENINTINPILYRVVYEMIYKRSRRLKWSIRLIEVLSGECINFK